MQTFYIPPLDDPSLPHPHYYGRIRRAGMLSLGVKENFEDSPMKDSLSFRIEHDPPFLKKRF